MRTFAVSNNSAWKNIIIGILALMASFFWGQVSGANPPFDEATWIEIVKWLGGLLLTGVFGFAAKSVRLQTVASSFAATKEIPDWWNLVLSVVALVAAALWTKIAPSNPPFDETMWTAIVVWLVNLAAMTIFGWNMKSLLVKRAYRQAYAV